MKRVRPTGVTLVRAVVGVAVASLVLAACGTTVAIPHAMGLPSIGISVPLTNVACTTSGSCIAVGTSSANVGPSSVGQYRKPSGRWAPIAVPSAPSSSLVASSCWSTACVFVGSQPSGDLLWLYDQTNHTVTSIPVPAGGRGVEAIDCTSSVSCAFIDEGGDGTPRFFLGTLSARATFVALPQAMTWAGPDHVTALACGSQFVCVATVIDGANHAAFGVTKDGGATWLTDTTLPSSWMTVNSLACKARSCVALVKTNSGYRVARTLNLGAKWRTVSVAERPTAMACATLNECVLGGVRGMSEPLLALYRDHGVTMVRLQYVPTPIGNVACSRIVCVAIGVTTVVSIRP